MGKNSLWHLAARLFLLAYMWLVMGAVKACKIASNLNLDSPFNVRRYEV